MKNKTSISLILLICLSSFISILFISLETKSRAEIYHQNGNNLNLQTSFEPIETSLFIIDNPGKMLNWNQTGAIYAKLITMKDKTPIPNQFLELHFNLNKNWTLLSTGFTNESGIVNFTFFVDMKNGDYTYKINYSGSSDYLSVESQSYITVIGDPTFFDITISNIITTDAGISFDYVVDVHLGILIGGISKIKVEITIGLYLLIFEPDISDLTVWEDFSDSFYTEYLLFLSLIPVHVGLILDWGTTNVEITVSAKVYYFFPIPIFPFLLLLEEDGSKTVSSTLVDDDTTPPEVTNDDYYPSVILQDPDDYNIKISGKDDSGLEAWIQYQFVNLSSSSDIYEYYLGSTPSPSITFTYAIPKAIWSQYPGTRIQFRTKIRDLDMDGGRISDSEVLDWGGWIEAGNIYSNIAGNIENIRTSAQIKTATGWEWQSVIISSSSPFHTYRDLYINDVNYIELSIFNPTSEKIAIENVELAFLSDDFAEQPSNRLIDLGTNNEIAAFEIKILTETVKFDEIDFDLNSFSSAVITMQFSFDYYLESNPSPYSSTAEKEYSIIKPPEPEINFIGFFGPQEDGNFIYKHQGKGSNILARFQVINKARLEIKLDQAFGFHDSTSSDLAELLYIENSENREITRNSMINAGQTVNVEFLLTPETSFFADERAFWNFLLGIGKTTLTFAIVINSILAIYKTSAWLTGAAKTLLTTGAATLNIATGVLLSTYHSILIDIAEESKLTSRTYDSFKYSTTSWYYSHKNSTTSNSDLYYANKQLLTSILDIKVSKKEYKQYLDGITLRYIAIGLIIAATVAFTVGGPWGIASGASLSLVAYLVLEASNYYWNEANDDIPLEENYKEVYQPNYIQNNFTDFQPRNEFEEVVKELMNTSIHMLGDLEALNETKSRKAAAIEAEEYEAVLLQNSALVKYSKKLASDYNDLQNDMELLNYYFYKNSTDLTEAIYQIELDLLSKGLTDDDILVLEAFDFNETEIQDINQSIIEIAINHEFSQITNEFPPKLNETLNLASPFIDLEIIALSNYSKEIINESIQIKTEILNEPITTADFETLQNLNQLKNDIKVLFLNGEWNLAIENADILIELAETVALQTNNNTYLEEYGEYAREKKVQAEEYLKLDLYHLKDVIVSESETKTINVIAHSKGAPTANYVLETNSSWVTPTQQTVPVIQYQNSIIELTITTENFIPGDYPVNLKIYLPQTKTIINSLLMVKVVDDDTTPPEIIIDYKGDRTDGNSGVWEINVTDIESGIDEIQILLNGDEIIHDETLNGLSSKLYTILVPKELDMHEIEVITKNNDKEWTSDQETSYTSESILISDDDTTIPTIQIIYKGGDGTDGNSGYFSWIITDADDGIGGDGDTGFSEIDIKVNYLSTEGLPDKEFILASSETGNWDLPPNLGVYTITIYAKDNDDDRTLLIDSLTITISSSQNIIDDDINPSEVSNLEISHDIHDVKISFNAIDDSIGDDQGIGEIKIFIDNKLIVNYAPIPTESIFDFSLSNDWIMEIGTHQVKIEVWDADDDRLGDSLLTVVSGTFEITFEEMKEFVNWEIDQLIKKIQSSSEECWRKPANNRKLTMNNNKINGLKEKISSNDFEDTYNKILHDIKPKLTGLKTDEYENRWGKGVFNNPWVISSDLNEEFRFNCNQILTHIAILISVV